jgi:hypothetical protein
MEEKMKRMMGGYQAAAGTTTLTESRLEQRSQSSATMVAHPRTPFLDLAYLYISLGALLAREP